MIDSFEAFIIRKPFKQGCFGYKIYTFFSKNEEKHPPKNGLCVLIQQAPLKTQTPLLKQMTDSSAPPTNPQMCGFKEKPQNI